VAEGSSGTDPQGAWVHPLRTKSGNQNQAVFTFAEKFVNRPAFEAHVNMPYAKRFSGQLDNLVQSKQMRLHRELVPPSQKGAESAQANKDSVTMVAHFTAKPGKQRDLQDFLLTLVAPTRSEPGCVRFEVNQNLDDPSTFTFVETFADKAGFDVDCATPYVKNLFEALPIPVKEQYIGLHKRIPA
jgi:quinol monooxygenase YgiN